MGRVRLLSSYQRPSWDTYFIKMACLTASRATCPRRRVGAVLVRDQRVLATGYNGSVRGAPHCDDVGCLIAKQGERESCVRTVHAELNAILHCALNGVSSAGATLYCTDFPCLGCAKALVQAGIEKIIYLSEYPDVHSFSLLRESGIALFKAVEDGQGGYRLVSPPRSCT
ncbi:MAG: dCMP deaminase family protein [Firmicutes bacterium]|nr:dCMP deaminase family protein [Bacillota bacterium]